MFSPFDPEILRFVYQLTKAKSGDSLSHQSLWRRIKSKDSLPVTSRTLQNWWQHLSKPYYLNGKNYHDRHLIYYPIFSKERLGLKIFYVLLDTDHQNFILDLLKPLIAYAIRVYSDNKAQLLLYFYVPAEAEYDFFAILDALQLSRHLEKFQVFEVGTPWMIYSPLHKVIDCNGNFDHHINDYQDIARQVKHCIRYLEKVQKCKLDEEVQGNPLVLAILMEQYMADYEHVTSVDKLKTAVQRRLRGWSKRSGRNPGKEIKTSYGKVRQAMHACQSRFIQQMAVSYLPLETGPNFVIYFVVDRGLDWRRSLMRVARCCISTRIYPMKPGGLFLVCRTNMNALQHLLKCIVNQKIQATMLPLYESSLPLLRKYHHFDYTHLFNPTDGAWHFDPKPYLEKIRNAG